MQNTDTLCGAGLGDVDDFDAFRAHRFNFLYLCRACARSFDSIVPMKKCKYCFSHVVEMNAKKRHPVFKEVYFRYYCPKCDDSFKSDQKRNECQMCRFDIIQYYRWEDMPLKDKIAVVFSRIRKSGHLSG